MIQLKHKVKRIGRGATIGVISPSWSGPHAFPVVYQKGLENLIATFGFKIKELPHVRSEYREDLKYVQERVDDIHQAFEDDEVEAIFIALGGSDSIRLLPYLDKKIITAHPKIVMGFSDATAILVYLAKLGIPSFHGPSVMAGFAEPEGLNAEFVEHFSDFFFGDWESYTYPAYKEWTEDRYGWTDPNFLGRKKEYRHNEGVRVVKGGAPAEGVLVGGCIEVLEMLKGTEYGLTASDWEESTFFFETSEDKPTPDYVECVLTSYGIAGAWKGVRNLIVSKARGYTEEEYKLLEVKVSSVVGTRFEGRTENILSNADIGHTQPMLIFPMGCRLRVEGTQMTLIESPFRTT